MFLANFESRHAAEHMMVSRVSDHARQDPRQSSGDERQQVRGPGQLETDWKAAPLLRRASQAANAGAASPKALVRTPNICKHCPNFRTKASFLSIFAARAHRPEALAPDAPARGQGDEVALHEAQELIGRAMQS